MKKLLFVLLVSFGLAQIGFSQNSSGVKVVNTLSGVVALTGEGGITIGQSDYATNKIQFLGKGTLEYFVPMSDRVSFGMKIYGAKGYFGGKSNSINPPILKTAFHLIGAGISLTFPLGERVYPYLAFGVSHMWTFPRDNSNDKDIVPMFKIITWNPEIGIRIMVGDNFSINLIGGLIAGKNDGNEDKLDGAIRGAFKDYIYTGTFGISYYIGRETDSDGDGVGDPRDMCPGTPMGVTVDNFGCPVDSDNDGVADYMDKCANSPAGAKVDASGCPLDSDNDGVADYMDKCANTPAGVSVDSKGCPVDSDNDGVADYLDNCPDTPAGAKVDEKGCPLDSDGDGVADYMDNCPDTPKGREVDKNGCTVKKVVKVEVMSGDANFAFNKAVLLPKAFASLDGLSETLKANSDYSARIEGYTDSIGSEEYNLKLSERRAQAVAEYLASKGVNRSQLQVVPMGEANPVASNKTKTGRAANRRVEIKINVQ